MANLVTPFGFRDVIGFEAAERERITRSVQDLFAQHGFAPIETPTLEVMDVVRQGGRIPSSPFKFFDSRGDLLAMRPDVTMQVARMCATRLPEGAAEARFRYTQRVFRDVEWEVDASPREITQIGVECIGQSGAEVDRELIGLFVEALSQTGVSEMCVTLATVGPLRALLERSGAPESWKSAVLAAYHDSDFVELDRLCSLEDCEGHDTSSIAPAYADVIKSLARVRGGLEAIEEARRLVAPLGCADGLDDLAVVYSGVSGDLDASVLESMPAGPQQKGASEAAQDAAADRDVRLLVDFSVVSSFDYYTGVVFAAFSPHLGTSLGSGGRYDRMIEAFGASRPAAGFAFCLEQVMAATAAEEQQEVDEAAAAAEEVQAALGHRRFPASRRRRLRIAVPKGALHAQAVECLQAAGLDVEGLRNIGRQLVIRSENADYIIVRPSDAPAFVAYGAADCGICGRDSLLESGAQVVELVDLGFGGCRFVVAQPKGATPQIDERYRKLGSIRVATKYPNITLAHYAKTGVQVDIVRLHGNIELAPLTGMAERIVDITATGTTLRENDLEIVEEVLGSTARFFANPCSLRTDDRVVELARTLAEVSAGAHFEPIAGKAM